MMRITSVASYRIASRLTNRLVHSANRPTRHQSTLSKSCWPVCRVPFVSMSTVFLSFTIISSNSHAQPAPAPAASTAAAEFVVSLSSNCPCSAAVRCIQARASDAPMWHWQMLYRFMKAKIFFMNCICADIKNNFNANKPLKLFVWLRFRGVSRLSS